jgi:multidrug efflux pump subunit AcrA (membrane-fusion protein)
MAGRCLPAWLPPLPLPCRHRRLPDRVVQPHPVDLTLPAEALVEAVNQATLAAQVSGRVVEVHVDAGQAVNKGRSADEDRRP